MDFKDLLQTMQHIDEGTDPSFDECGSNMPSAIIQGGPLPEESLNMNLTINSKGADGIRELIDVLKGIGNNDSHTPTRHDDDDKLLGNDEAEIVIGDDYENEVDGDAGPKVFNLDTLLHQGDKKGKEAPKQAGGGNPWNIRHESVVNNLAALYEDVKDRVSKSEKRAQSDQAYADFIKSGGVVKKHDPQKEPGKKPYSPPKRKNHSDDEFKLRSNDDSIAKIPTVGFRKEPPIVNPKKKKLTPDWENKLSQLAAIKEQKKR